MPLQHTARPRIDPDIDLKFEPGMGAGIDRVRSHGARVLSILEAGANWYGTFHANFVESASL